MKERVVVKEKDSAYNTTKIKDSITVEVKRGIYDFSFEIGIDVCDIDGDRESARIGLTRDEALGLCNSILECISFLDEVYKGAD